MPITAGLQPSEIEALKEKEAIKFEMKGVAFGITAHTDEVIQHKIDTSVFSVLNTALNISDYGTDIQQIIFTFIALAPEFDRQKQSVEYRSDDKIATIELELDYEKMLTAQEVEVNSLMQTLYLKGLRSLVMFDIEDFELELLCKDVEAYLQKV